MPRRAKGEGTIRKRASDGVWEGRVTVGVDPATGKYVTKSVYNKSQRIVREKMQELATSVSVGNYIPDPNMTVGEWLDMWLQIYARRSVKRDTLVRYEGDIRLHIKPVIGHIQLSKLTTAAAQAVVNLCVDGGLSQKSAANCRGVLLTSLNCAVDNKLIAENPVEKTSVPVSEEPKTEMRPLKDNEVPIFLQLIHGQRFELFYIFALFTGARFSEILGLSWDCIDFEHSRITLYRQLCRPRKAGEQHYFSTLKSKQKRSFVVAQQVMNALREQRRRQAERRLIVGESWNNPYNLVFTNDLGGHLALFTVYKDFKKIVRRMGLDMVRFHDLRHTYATLSLQNGVNYKTLSHNLGHRTVAFTMDVYGHVSETMEQEAADKMTMYINTCQCISGS